jgi:predicted SprT family Zn-dependent metalloprotease
VDNPDSVLEPLPYHLELRAYLRSEEPELWNWFSSAQAKTDYAEKLRIELLKTTYRLDIESHPDLHASLNEVKARLNLDMPVTLYQAQNSPQQNATLFYMPGHGHIVFSGPVLTLLNPDELKSVIAHELAHYHLWDRDHGEFHIADRLVNAMANDPRASASHEQTARRYQLYTEIFADRGSLRASERIEPVVASLVKMETGLSNVSAASYLRQAAEIFANAGATTEGISHPEAFIRVRALSLWQQQGNASAPDVEQMIDGGIDLDTLDLLSQKRLTSLTRRVLQQLLSPKWFQTPATLGHARLFFADFQSGDGTDAALVEELKTRDGKVREYLCYLLLDFVHADPELEEAALAAAFDLSRRLEIEAQFEKIVVKELKMRVRDVRRVKEQASEILAKVEANSA